MSFEVFKGECLGIVGESGSGKTTLGKTILNLLPPTDGQVFYNGFELFRLSKRICGGCVKDLQIIFQNPYSSLNPRIPVGKAIQEPMAIHGLGKNESDRRERTIALMEKVGMGAEHYDRYPHEFSGGQRQRICIARALAVEPSLIVCDEAVSSFRFSIQAQVLNLLKDLQESLGLTYLFISHDLSVVKFMSDRIMVMKDGKIVELADAESIYKAPKADYTQSLIEAIPKTPF